MLLQETRTVSGLTRGAKKHDIEIPGPINGVVCEVIRFRNDQPTKSDYMEQSQLWDLARRDSWIARFTEF